MNNKSIIKLVYRKIENDHTHSANQRREFSCSIFHKLSGITSISMLYIEHTNDAQSILINYINSLEDIHHQKDNADIKNNEIYLFFLTQ